MESLKSKTDKKHLKELNSFKNKMGPNLVWFNSLSKTKQYDILFLWKREKWSNKSRPKLITIYNHITRRRERILNPTLKLKHWITTIKHIRRFASIKTKIRNSAIDIILNKK
jgi:hypothetical protein